jgi:hypothetical protein
LLSKTKRTGERERSVGQKMVEREKHVKWEREGEREKGRECWKLWDE